MDRIKYFQIPFFAVVMGLSGLAIAYQKAHHIFAFPKFIYECLLFLSSILFLVILYFYAKKAVLFFEEVIKDFFHPIRINFFAAFSISLLLLSIAFYSYYPIISIPLWYFGTLLHLFMTFYVVSFWIRHNFEITHTNPVWFIPIVGNVLVPVIGVDLLPKEVSLYFFSVGIFFWILLSTIIFYRVIFHHQMAQKFIPTLFIFIAPPAVGFISYIKILNSFDFTANILLSIALFFAILLFFMGKSFLNLKFFISWWAFTFPLDAIAIAFMVAFQITHNTIYAIFGVGFLAIATVVIGYVSFQTVKNILYKEICIEE
ncbi:MAG: C4-dicarboxylate ABC transporter [Campylobacterales bacterium]|nr:C4-dicarboxylate ABC transporter [Campylobacterales bacterium]